jgi:hypothetical protein
MQFMKRTSNGGRARPAGRIRSWVVLVAVLTVGSGTLRARSIPLPNGSFESPATAYVTNRIDDWQKTPKPFWYDESTGFTWDQLTGLFKNTDPGSADHIDNCDGAQGVYLFAVPEAGFFQDYDSIGGTNAAPTHALDVRFNVGRSYRMTVGVIGGGGAMTNGVSLQLSLYYRDSANNRVTVAASEVVYDPAVFLSTTHFLDFTVEVPTVRAADPWAGQHLGVAVISSVTPALAGGYWDLDQVRLSETIDVPNGSFESPVTDYVTNRIDEWQKTPKPLWYDESTGFTWDQLTGLFRNTAPGSADYIANCDGAQGAYLFAVPEVGLAQDYDSIGGTNATPTHAFDVRFEVGWSYQLTVGLIAGGGGMKEGVSLRLGLYYRDDASNAVMVVSTNVVFSLAAFPDTTNLVDWTTRAPTVQPGDAWAGRRLGVQLLSTVSPDLAGGYWDLDHVRLTADPGAVLTNPAARGGQLEFTLRSEPGLVFEILAASDAGAPITGWSRVGLVTNTTGSSVFTDPMANATGRFYQARQLP